jgi:hypothetical protein
MTCVSPSLGPILLDLFQVRYVFQIRGDVFVRVPKLLQHSVTFGLLEILPVALSS